MPVTQKSPLEIAVAAIVRGTHRDPFAVLGPHLEGDATIVRAFQPAARSMALRLVDSDTVVAMEQVDPAGLFEVRLKPDTTEEGVVAGVVSGLSRTVPD